MKHYTVLNIKSKWILCSYTPLISQNYALFSLIYVSKTLNLFLLFWWLLKWFWLYGLLYHHHIFTFSRMILTFCSLNFFFFPLNITIQRLLLPTPIGTNLFHRLLHGIILGIPFFFFFLLNGQMFPWSYASPFLFVWLVLLLHSMVHYSRYFLRMVLDRTILPVLECLKKDFILSSLWLITWFDVKSALEIIWSQNINFYLFL